MTRSLSKLHAMLDLHLLPLLLVHQLAVFLRNYQSFFSLRITSPIKLPHSLRQPRVDLPLPDSSLLHDHLTSPVSSSPLLSPGHHPVILPFQTQNFSISQVLYPPYRHLAPLRTDFTDTRTALPLFSLFQFFPSFQLSLFPSVLVFLSQVSYLSHNRLFLVSRILFF